jgi:hypothetical protein
MRIIIWILGILVIATCMWWSYKEGFQLASSTSYRIADQATTQTNFWNISSKVDAKDAATIAALARVTDADPTDKKDIMPLQFSKYISMYAMAKYNNDLSGARQALFNNYNQLQSEMSTSLYDQSTVSSWKANPKEKTCDQLDNARKTLTQKIFDLRSKIQDLSGTSVLASSMRDENMEYQNKYKNKCPGTSLSPACIQLANKEGPVFPLLAKYEDVNNNIFSTELDINADLETLNDTYNFLQCDRSLKSSFIKKEGTTDIYYLNIDTMTIYPVSNCSTICGMNLCNAVTTITAEQMTVITNSVLTSSSPFTCAMLYDGTLVKGDNDQNKVYYVTNDMKYLITSCSSCNLDLCSKAKIVNGGSLNSLRASSTPFTCSLLPAGVNQDTLDAVGKIAYSSDTNVGMIDTTILRTKLQQLSPYYLSPDTLQYITTSIISAADSQATIMTTSDILINITNIINNIKILTNTA